MCGIHIYPNNYTPVTSIDHRGIDSFQMDHAGYTFKHVTLPLQTMSKNRQDYLQPVKIKDGLFLLYNGEIFNYRKFGIHTSDLDYLKSFFKDGWNDRLIMEMNRWDGMWAIVLLDTTRDQCMIFTDPLGKKQLYYSLNGICSEIKPLLEKEKNLIMDYDEKCFGKLNTPFFWVNRFLPNTLYLWDIHSTSPAVYKRNYFNFMAGTLKDNIIDMMDLSIRDRLINKMDEVTLFLSGGMDSTIILYHLMERGIKPELLSIENMDDEKYIKIVEKHFDVKSRRIKPDKTLLEEAVRTYEHPLDYGSLLPQYCLCKEASNRVIFTGDGADELFGGYSRMLKSDNQDYDIKMELPYYHLIRLDRVGMHFTKEIRSPFLSVDLLKYAISKPYSERIGTDDDLVLKRLLKNAYNGIIPASIINRRKTPLRLDGNKDSGVKDLFYNKLNGFKHELRGTEGRVTKVSPKNGRAGNKKRK